MSLSWQSHFIILWINCQVELAENSMTLFFCIILTHFVCHCYYTVSQKRSPFYFLKSWSKSLNVNLKKNWHQIIINLPTSPVYCGHTTLRTEKCLISTMLFTHASEYLGYHWNKWITTVIMQLSVSLHYSNCSKWPFSVRTVHNCRVCYPTVWSPHKRCSAVILAAAANNMLLTIQTCCYSSLLAAASKVDRSANVPNLSAFCYLNSSYTHAWSRTKSTQLWHFLVSNSLSYNTFNQINAKFKNIIEKIPVINFMWQQ